MTSCSDEGPVDTKIIPSRPADRADDVRPAGSGKTTTCGKLALLLKHRGNHPMLVAARFAATGGVQQLKVVGEQAGVPVFADETKSRPSRRSAQGQTPSPSSRGIAAAREQGCDIVILDTAGRRAAAIDEALMANCVT